MLVLTLMCLLMTNTKLTLKYIASNLVHKVQNPSVEVSVFSLTCETSSGQIQR